MFDKGNVSHNVTLKACSKCSYTADCLSRFPPVIFTQRSLFFFFCFRSTLPSPCMLVLKKHNAMVYEMILVRIEKSHPHYSTTRSDVPCACTASLLTVPVCTCLFFLPVFWNTVLFLRLQVSHLCLDYTFTKVTVFPPLRRYCFGVLLSITSTAHMLGLSVWNDCIHFYSGWNWLSASVLFIGAWHKN